MSKKSVTWHSPRLGESLLVARWGHAGQPVVLFPTAGGDAEECERMLMIRALGPLIDAGRIRVYSVDHVAGWRWIDGDVAPAVKVRTQHRFNAFVREELAAVIRAEGGLGDGGIIAAGYSLGGFQAFAGVLRNPDLFRAAICLSSPYDLSPWVTPDVHDDFHHTSPLHFLPFLQDEASLAPLRDRFVLMVHGRGRVEKPWRAWPVADLLGSRGIPNRVDIWSEAHDHDWVAWREQLPLYLDRLTA